MEEDWGDLDLFQVRPGAQQRPHSSAPCSSGEAGARSGKKKASATAEPGAADGSVVLNPNWLSWLQSHTLREEDGFPRASRAGEDPRSVGVILQWVFQSIVSTTANQLAQARRVLGRPSDAPGPKSLLLEAHERLLAGLEAAYKLGESARQGRQLLTDLILSRKRHQELLAEHPDIAKPVAKVVSPWAAAVAATPSFCFCFPAALG